MLKAIQQSQDWAEFQKSLPDRKAYLVDGFFAYKLFLSKKLNLSLLYLPGINSLPKEPTLKKLRQLCHQEKISFIHLEPYYQTTKTIPGAKPSPISYIEPFTRIINLQTLNNEAKILNQMKSKGRYNIRLAEKKGITIRQEQNTDNFYQLLKTTSSRDDFHIHDQNYYQQLLDKLGNRAILLTAFYQNSPIASLILTRSENTMTYYYGASDNQFRELMAPYLLQWEGIKLASKLGLHYYDFLGIKNPHDQKPHPLTGVSQFKSMFGGEVLAFAPAIDLPIAKIKYYCYFSYKYLQKLFKKQ